MILKTNRQAKAGFSLLEMTVVLIVISILASAVIPQLIKGYAVNAANKTALEISAIEEASRAYYIANNQWPADIAALQAGNYLPFSWNGINPFGYSLGTSSNYSYNISSNAYLLTVSTTVPVAAQPIIQNLLPVTTVSGTTINSSVPVPGSLSVMPTGSITAWASSTLPAGFLWCNGQAVSRTAYSGLFSVIGTTYGTGDGSTTFNLPDTMGRTIVGVDGIGGVSPANRVTKWGSGPATIGGTFGEDAHRQTVQEMAPHTHGNVLNFWGADASHGLPGGAGTGINSTSSTGGDGDGTGLGASSNVVQPSIALGYIIKY